MSINIYNGKGDAISVPQNNDKYLKMPWMSSYHTGYSSETVPHNTLQAYHRAWLIGADAVEIDIQMTSDGVYVCSHDETITDPQSGTVYNILTSTWDTIKDIVLATDEKYGVIKPSKLEDVLKFCCASGLFANLDCKTINAKTLATMVVTCGMSGKTIYAATGLRAFKEILEIDSLAGALILWNANSDEHWLDDWNPELSAETKSRSYVANVLGVIPKEYLLDALKLGYKYEFISQSNVIKDFDTAMGVIPHIYQFAEYTDINVMNAEYLKRFTSMALVN